EGKGREAGLPAERLAGGVHALVDRYVRPESLVDGLAQALAGAGGELREHAAVEGLEAANGGVRVETGSETIPADRAVVAAGASSPPLLKRLGISLPPVGARGDSHTFAG